MPRTKNFAEVIRKKLASDPALAAAVEEEAFGANVASRIYAARTAAKLTQSQLADRIGSQQSVIARLEDADYSGHSLSMLKKIANALGLRLTIAFSKKITDAIEDEDGFELVIGEALHWHNVVEWNPTVDMPSVDRLTALPC